MPLIEIITPGVAWNATFVSRWWLKLVQYAQIADRCDMNESRHVTPVILLHLLFFDRWS